MQGQNTAIFANLAVQEAPALIAALIGFFGRRRTGMTGEQKQEKIVDIVAPLVPVAVDTAGQAALNNSSDAAHRAEIADLTQKLHAAMLAAGQIEKTSALESAPTALGFGGSPASSGPAGLSSSPGIIGSSTPAK